MGDHLYERIYRIVQRIPLGRVATYGHIADLAGVPKGARQVGYALASLRRGSPGPRVPWHRVVNAQGASSLGEEQIDRLRSEGVVFDDRERVDLGRFGWDGVSRA